MSEEWKGRFAICEGIAGVWHYHLHRLGEPHTRSLCGKQTMLTHSPLSTWGVRSHLPQKYCAACEQMANEETASPSIASKSNPEKP